MAEDGDERTTPEAEGKSEAKEKPAATIAEHSKLLSEHHDRISRLEGHLGISQPSDDFLTEQETPGSARRAQREKDYDRLSHRKRS